MRGIQGEQTDLFSYVQPEDRIPQLLPLHKICQMVDQVLANMDAHISDGEPNGLIIDITASESKGTAECQEELHMLAHNAKHGSTVGADTGYGTNNFVCSCRKIGVTSHVASKKNGSAIDGQTVRHPGCRISRRIRKRIEEGFGC